MASTSKDMCRRAHLRTQLCTGRSLKNFELTEAKKEDLWVELLRLHLDSARPGRAVARCDIRWMLANRQFRITTGNSSSSTDGPATGRSLSDAEVCVIARFNAIDEDADPMDIRLSGVEDSLAAQAELYHETGLAAHFTTHEGIAGLKAEFTQQFGSLIAPNRELLDLLDGNLPEKIQARDSMTHELLFDKTTGDPVWLTDPRAKMRQMQRYVRLLQNCVSKLSDEAKIVEAENAKEREERALELLRERERECVRCR
jgi:hypothetical protein